MTENLVPPLPRGAVALPEIGPQAYLRMSIPGLEALNEEFGDDYLQHLFDKLDAMSILVMKAVGKHAAQNCSVDQVLEVLLPNDAAKRLADALSMSINGRTVEEEMAKREEDAIQEVARVRKLREAMDAKNV